MTLSLNCKDAGDPVCAHTVYGETEDQVLENAKRHVIESHGYTEEKVNESFSKNREHYKQSMKSA
ncbi:hypothetical protein BH23THE1_BH23THE1_36530 [soil metagenome]